MITDLDQNLQKCHHFSCPMTVINRKTTNGMDIAWYYHVFQWVTFRNYQSICWSIDFLQIAIVQPIPRIWNWLVTSIRRMYDRLLVLIRSDWMVVYYQLRCRFLFRKVKNWFWYNNGRQYTKNIVTNFINKYCNGYRLIDSNW